MSLLTPQDMPSWVDGADNTAALREWSAAITGGVGLVPPGIYRYSTGWSIHSPCSIRGAGMGLSVFKSTNPAAEIRNANPRWSLTVDPINGGPPLDHDISISGVCFEGADMHVPGGQALVALVGVERLRLRDVMLRKHQLDLVVTHNCIDVLGEGCRMYDWGNKTPPVGVGQFVGGCAVYAWLENDSITLVDCIAERGGGGFLLGGTRTVLRNCRVRDVDEVAVSGIGQYSIIDGLIAGKVRNVDVSGSAFEGLLDTGMIVNSILCDSDHSAIYLFNPRRGIVGHVIVVRPNRAKAANTSGITASSWGPEAGVGDRTECVLIHGTIVCDEDMNSTHAIDIADMGGGDVEHVVVMDNNTGSGGQWTDGAIAHVKKGVTAVHN